MPVLLYGCDILIYQSDNIFQTDWISEKYSEVFQLEWNNPVGMEGLRGGEWKSENPKGEYSVVNDEMDEYLERKRNNDILVTDHI